MPTNESLLSTTEKAKVKKTALSNLYVTAEDGKPLFVLNLCAGKCRISDLRIGTGERDQGFLLGKNEIADLTKVYSVKQIEASKDLKGAIDKGYIKILADEAEVAKEQARIARSPLTVSDRLKSHIKEYNEALEPEEKEGINDDELERDVEREIQKKNEYDKKLAAVEKREKNNIISSSS